MTLFVAYRLSIHSSPSRRKCNDNPLSTATLPRTPCDAEFGHRDENVPARTSTESSQIIYAPYRSPVRNGIQISLI